MILVNFLQSHWFTFENKYQICNQTFDLKTWEKLHLNSGEKSSVCLSRAREPNWHESANCAHCGEAWFKKITALDATTSKHNIVSLMGVHRPMW